MNQMTAKYFSTLSIRDLENGAVINEIYSALKEREELFAQKSLSVTEEEVNELVDRMAEYPSYHRAQHWLESKEIRVIEE